MKWRNHQSFRYRDRICITNINIRDFYVHHDISLNEYIGISTFFLIRCCPPPPVIHNFRYKACVEHGNEWYIKRKLCFTGGGGAASYKKKLKFLYILSKKCPDGHNNLNYWYLLFKYGPDTFDGLMVSVLHKWKIELKCEIEKLIKNLGRNVRLIVRSPFKYNGNTAKIPGTCTRRWMIFKVLQDWTSFLPYTCTRHYSLSLYSRCIVMDVVLIISTFN